MERMTIALFVDVVVPLAVVVLGSSSVVGLVVKYKLDKHEKKAKAREEKAKEDVRLERERLKEISKMDMEINMMSAKIDRAKHKEERCHQGFQDEVYRSIHTGKSNGELTKAKDDLDYAQGIVDSLYEQKETLMAHKNNLIQRS